MSTGECCAKARILCGSGWREAVDVGAQRLLEARIPWHGALHRQHLLAGAWAEGDAVHTRGGLQRPERAGRFRIAVGREVEAAALWHQLLALLLHLACDVPLPERASTAQQAHIHRRFAQAVEASLGQRVPAREHAARLRVSESTLARASKSVAGRSAKQWMAKRTLLEAKRLLVHGSTTVTSVVLSLGFDDATNFVKFFRRMEGQTPAACRAKLTGER